MGGSQLEHALDLIDANLLTNRDEVLNYIGKHPEAVETAYRGDGRLRVETKAGVLIIDLNKMLSAA